MKKWKPRATDICCICLKNRMQAVGNSHAKYHQHITAYRTAAGQSDMLFSGTLNEPISKRRSTRYLFQISSYSIPPGSLDAGSHASDIFCTDEHNIAKQTAFVNRCAEMRLRWKAACFFARYDFLLGHLRIDQMAVHISVFFVGLECANDRDFCSRFGIVGRIAMLAREDEFQPLRCRGSRLQRPQSWLPFRRSSGRRGSSGSFPELPSKSAPNKIFRRNFRRD